MICSLILAAGLSSRMNEFKPLLPLQGKTVIECTIDSVLDSGVDKITVVTGHRSDDLSSLIKDKYPDNVITVKNKKYAQSDMLYSIKTGLSVMPECDAFFILPGDMPMINPSTFQLLMSAYNGKPHIIFPTLSGFRKHPPLIDHTFIPDILRYSGDGGLRSLWKKYENYIIEIPVQDKGVWIDLDTHSDYIDLNNYLKNDRRWETE